MGAKGVALVSFIPYPSYDNLCYIVFFRATFVGSFFRYRFIHIHLLINSEQNRQAGAFSIFYMYN